MRNKLIKTIALVLAGLFLLSLVVTVIAGVAYAKDVPSRDETVYVDLDAAGAVREVVSSVYLTNPEALDELTDSASLTELKLLTGFDAPKEDGETVRFRADGEDICYQGTADAGRIPFAVEIRYYLDGRQISAGELAGKGGRVRIEIATKNLSPNTVQLEGASLAMYTPFTIICMASLSEDYTAVTTSGKLNVQAGVPVVLGLLMPGLRESLDTDDAKNDKIKDTLTIEANVTNFSLDALTMIGMVGILDESDLSDLDDIQEMLDGINDMQDAAYQLYKGAKELEEGADDFADGAGDFADGTGDLKKGAYDAADGAMELKNGLWTLHDSIDQLYNGVTAGGGPSASDLTALIGGLTSLAGSLASTDPVSAALIEDAIDALTQLSSGSGGIASGLAGLRGGAKKSAEGMGELTEGLYELAEGTKDLEEGAMELRDGAIDLRDGIRKIKDGLRKLDRDGLREMVDETSTINISLSRKDALLVLGNEYTAYSYTGAPEEKKCSVQFVLTTEAIEPELPIEPQAAGEGTIPAPTEQVAPWDKIENWFKGVWETIRSWFS